MSDTVNRQDAIEAFWKLDIELRPSAIDAITDMLKTLPSAEPERFTHRKEKVIQMMIKIIAICILSIMLGILIGMHI